MISCSISRRRSRLSSFRPTGAKGHFIGVVRVLDRICERAKLADVTPHTLRHTFASLAGDLGFSELTIAALLGARFARCHPTLRSHRRGAANGGRSRRGGDGRYSRREGDGCPPASARRTPIAGIPGNRREGAPDGVVTRRSRLGGHPRASVCRHRSENVVAGGSARVRKM